MSAVSPGVLEVSAGEDGMKLLRFLERRLAGQAPKAALHKWIRTGQVRVNKGRAKPFLQLAAGDLVRIPPFALARNVHPFTESDAPVPVTDREQGLFHAPSSQARQVDLGPDIRIVAGNGHLLVLAKPAGLPCQPGSGHEDNVCARLAEAFSGAPFIPAPAHRIDRHTSGLLLAGMTHAAQRRLHALFASGGIAKEYLAWVFGDWPRPGPCLLEDRLGKHSSGPGREGMAALPGGKITPLPFPGMPCPPGTALSSGPAGTAAAADAAEPAAADAGESAATDAGESAATDAGESAATDAGEPDVADNEKEPGFAASAALAVCTAPEGSPFRATLLLLRLFTGRTHQLRVQLASRGFPIIGDGRYGGPRFSHMLLHAFALSLPEEDVFSSAAARGCPAPGRLEFTTPPSWPEPFMPDEALLFAARQRLASALATGTGKA